jgi:sulfite reductase alpha subunit
MAESKTPLWDQREGGKWPSFVKDMKQAAKKNPMAEDLLGQLELSYKVKQCWLREEGMFAYPYRGGVSRMWKQGYVWGGENFTNRR